MTNTKLAVTVEPLLRKKAEKVLDELGLDMDSAVRVFLKKVVATHSIPFALAEEPPPYRFTPSEENEILAAAKEARDPRQTSDSFDTSDALVAHLRPARA